MKRKICEEFAHGDLRAFLAHWEETAIFAHDYNYTQDQLLKIALAFLV